MCYKYKYKIMIVFAALALAVASADCPAYEYHASDFITEVIDYDSAGATSHTNSAVAIGPPSIDTDYYGADRPILPVNAAIGSGQVVRIADGHLILKFDHKVADDINNPYGVDFIVFGNAWQKIGGGANWTYGDPAAMTIATDIIFTEAAIVSVSQDGTSWYTYDPNQHIADTFAPTLGRVYDTENPADVYPGWSNLWWGEPTNPTLPVDPNMAPSDFIGKTVAEMCAAYGTSAGGTGFDLRWLAPADFDDLRIDPETGRRWIQYIMIKNADTSGIFTPEIDAASDVAACGDYRHPFPAGDLNADCSVNLFDVAILAANWLECTWECR